MMRCLFVGLGGVGQRHARNLRALLGNDVAISAYRVRRETEVIGDKLSVRDGENVESKYGIEVFDDYERALSGRPHCVFVTNPTSLHVPTALRAAEAGCHLFIEKPLSHDSRGVEQLVEVAERRQVVGFVAFQLRFHPAFRRLRGLLWGGALGRILCARAEVGEWLPGFHPYEDYRRMYASRSDLGGGVTVTQIHELDYLYALFGMPRRVFSLGGKVSPLEIDVDDLSSTLLEYRHPDGTVVPVHVHQDYFQRPKKRELCVVGTRGKLEWSLSEQTLTWWDAEGRVSQHVDYSDFERNQMFVDELTHFLECVDKKASPEVSLRQGADSLRIAAAILESQRTGSPVELDGRRVEEEAA